MLETEESYEIAEPRLSTVAFSWWLIVCGAIGFAGSFALTLESFLRLSEPDRIASCELNVFVTCGPSMDSAMGSLFGFPNPVMGVAIFPVVIALGAMLLITKFDAPRWFWQAFVAGTSMGMVFVVSMIFTSLHSLGSLCPYCMVVWAAMIPLFAYVLAYARQEGALGKNGGPGSWLVRNRLVVMVGIFVALIGWVFIVLGPEILKSL